MVIRLHKAQLADVVYIYVDWWIGRIRDRLKFRPRPMMEANPTWFSFHPAPGQNQLASSNGRGTYLTCESRRAGAVEPGHRVIAESDESGIYYLADTGSSPDTSLGSRTSRTRPSCLFCL